MKIWTSFADCDIQNVTIKAFNFSSIDAENLRPSYVLDVSDSELLTQCGAFYSDYVQQYRIDDEAGLDWAPEFAETGYAPLHTMLEQKRDALGMIIRDCLGEELLMRLLADSTLKGDVFVIATISEVIDQGNGFTLKGKGFFA